MVEYIKSKKGYFYKVYKNGEKKRISKEDYSKNIKRVGNGSAVSRPSMVEIKHSFKTQEEIIKELQTKQKYKEWIDKGSYYGLISDTLNAELFKVRPYSYYDVNNNIIRVSMIQKDFRPDVINIPVFGQVIKPRPSSYISQGTFKIVDKNQPLNTAGLATCTGLAMNIGNKKFMTHLDALTNIEDIIIAIKDTMKKEKIKGSTIHPTIYAGTLDSELTIEKAKQICTEVSILTENITQKYVCMIDDITF